MPKPKELVRAEAESWGLEWDEDCKIRKAPGPLRHYFLYWIDGQIEHRDTYMLSGYDNRPLLLFAEKRYAPFERWIPET
jgi:hypothetical protein